MIDFSVIITTYNSSFEDVKRTIDSCLIQKNIEFEIIICDDCSKENNFELIEEYLIENAKSKIKYKLLDSPKNEGTVCNCLKGLNEALGSVSKLIGAGDMLYDENTLNLVYDYIKKTNVQSVFGAIEAFCYKDNKYSLTNHISPRDINAYRNKDNKKIEKNLLLCEDWVSGVAVFAKTDYYKKYLSLLKGHVRFCEDWASALALLDNVYMEYIDEYLVRYESTGGISTSSAQRDRLLSDNKGLWQFFDEYYILKDRLDLTSIVKKRKRKKSFDSVKNQTLSKVLKAIFVPEMVLFELDVRKQAKQKLHDSKT